MEYVYSDRVAKLQPSAIREILKFTSVPGFIPFSAGNPAPEAFPTEAVSEITKNIMEKNPIGALQYSVTEGYEPLRMLLTEYMKKEHNVGRDFDNIIITAGAQQIMDLVTKSFCNEGDTVICECPSFIGSLNAFRSYNLNLKGIPVDTDGMDIALLEEALKTEKNVKFIYTIPNFQNPSGVTMSAEKRKAVYNLAKQYGVMILEDNPYGDVRFAGTHIAPIKSMDEDGIVVYAGSFSKVLSPGLRVGYCIAPNPVVSKLTVCKQTSDVHTTIFSQIIAHDFMKNYDFAAHLEKIREIYRKKAGLMMEQLDKHLAGKITYLPIEGGLFIWCRLPDGIDMMDFCKKGIEHKVAVVPGSAFMMSDDDPCQNFRINFSTPTDEQIVTGTEILGKIAETF